MKTKKKLSLHSHFTVNALTKRRKRRLPWSALLTVLALVTATFLYTADPPKVQAVSTTILISEVESSGIAGGGLGEWFELVNVSGAPITLTNWTISDNGGTDTIPTITINPGEYVVIAADVATFNINHPGFAGTVVELPSTTIGNGLADGGDRLELRDNTAALIDAMSYGTDTTYFTLPATTAGTNVTYQRASTFDTDSSNEWNIAVETPGAPAPILPYVDSSSSAGDFDAVLDTGFVSGKTLTWAHTVGSGNNRVLVVGISTEIDAPAGVPADRVSGVTYNGIAMTRIPGTSIRDASNRAGVEMFILVNPPVGTANVVATILPGVNYVVGGATSFFNVNQTTPTRTATVNTGTGITPTTAVITVVGDIVIDTVATLPSGFLAPGPGQTERWDGDDFFSVAFDVGAGSTEPAAATTTTMNWTQSVSQSWAIAAVPLQPAAVTAVRMSDFTAVQTDSGVALRWQTGYEVDNLGFNIYREQRGKRVRLNPAIIAGSALLARQGTSLTAGQSYAWADRAARGKEPVQYWLEDIDLDGTRTLHGPIVPAARNNAQPLSEGQAIQLSQLNLQQMSAHVSVKGYPAEQNLREDVFVHLDRQPQKSRLNGKVLMLSDELLEVISKETPAATERRSVAQGNSQNSLNAQATGAALKIAIRQPGWYRITQTELIAAGLSPNVDPSLLQLYADGVEQPILQTGANLFDAAGSIEFYATGMDTPSSDRRIYWLVVGAQPGRRIDDQIGLGLNVPVGTTKPAPLPVTQPEPTLPQPVTTPGAGRRPVEQTPVLNAPPPGSRSMPLIPLVQPWIILNDASPAASTEPEPAAAPKKKARKKKKTARKVLKPSHHHGLIRQKAVQDFTPSQSFNYVLERRERINYFSGLLNGGKENFFGPLVLNGSPTSQDLSVNHIDSSSSSPATLEIALQGLTGQAHEVRVSLNGTQLGVLSFTDLENKTARFFVPHTSLVAGNNALTLVSQGGEADISLVDYVRLTYRHTYRAESDTLSFTSQHTTPLTVSDFTSPQIRVFDISDPNSVAQVNAKAAKSGSGYAVRIPGSKGALRTLLAVTESQILRPAEITRNEPSDWARTDNRADFVILTHRSFRDAVKPLADLRKSQGMEVSVVDVEDVYDEFSYGAHSPVAIRDFLAWTKTHWALAPRYALLVGDASLDPRNYLGFGNHDFVPTKLIDATFLETASDDALADFNNDGLADIALGRLPVKTVEQAQKLIGKITAYAPGQPAYNALLVSDRKEGYDFEAANNQVRSLLPQDLSVTFVNRRDNSATQVRSEIINGINAGPLLVNYAGHGSSDVWTGAGILNASDALALTNGNRLPFFIIMTCLNGRFHDPFRETLSEALMRAEQGGAIATWASSGLTEPDAQSAIDQQLMRLLFNEGQSPLLGDAVRGAKAATANVDVRRTWIFFGDPTMRIR